MAINKDLSDTMLSLQANEIPRGVRRFIIRDMSTTIAVAPFYDPGIADCGVHVGQAREEIEGVATDSLGPGTRWCR